MRIFKRIEQGERVSFLMSGIEEDNLVSGRVVVFLITCKKYIGTEIWEHLSYAMNEYIRLVIAIVGVEPCAH
jgi:hypothetical protein